MGLQERSRVVEWGGDIRRQSILCSKRPWCALALETLDNADAEPESNRNQEIE